MRVILFLTMVFISLTLFGQKEDESSVHWRSDRSAELKIDESEYSKDKKGLLIYFLSNDDENLYIDMKIKGGLVQNKILKGGMTIWINPDGKARKKAGVRYPIGYDYSVSKMDFENTINPPTLLSAANMIQLTGFKDIQPSRFPSDNKDNIRGRVKYNETGDLIYTLILPFSKLAVLKEDTTGTGALTIGFEYGAPPETKVFSVERKAVEVGSEVVKVPVGSAPPTSVGKRPSGKPMSSGSPGSRPPVPSPETGAPVLYWVKEISLAKRN